ncbi:exopolysaccharide production repressor protein [Mesorhizobium sp. USDA 4775]|jgi:exopolysaccharide production repressor protein|nr:hypothetical protein MesoLj131c_02930 [Mesorhizobium sp. 131-3-5]
MGHRVWHRHCTVGNAGDISHPAIGGQMGGPAASQMERRAIDNGGRAIMYFPQFLVGMFTTSAVVAIWAEMETGSVGKALVWTVLTLMMLQVGYFLLAFGLFYKRSTESTDTEPDTAHQPVRRDGSVSSGR